MIFLLDLSDTMRNGIKYVLIGIGCLLTFLNQFIYHYQPSNDSLYYLQMAEQYRSLQFFDPAANCYGHFMYALFLALTGTLFSYQHYVIGFIQALIFGSSVLLLIREMERQWGRDLIAVMALVMLVPEIHFFNGYIITESLAFSLIILSFYTALKIYGDGATIKRLLLLSLLVALTALNRLECGVIIVPLFYLIYPAIRSSLFRSTALLILFPVVLLQLDALKNYHIFGVYKMGAFNGGEVLYGGNSGNLDGSHHIFWDHKRLFIPEEKIGELNRIQAEPVCALCPKRDAFFTKLAVDAWKKDPVRQLGVIPDKLAKNWLLPGDFDVYTADTTKTRGLQVKRLLAKENFGNAWYAPYKHLFYMTVHWAVLVMLLVGMIRYDRENRFQRSVLILLLFYILFAIPFCGLPRWHVAIFPLLIITFTPLTLAKRINRLFGI